MNTIPIRLATPDASAMAIALANTSDVSLVFVEVQPNRTTVLRVFINGTESVHEIQLHSNGCWSATSALEI